MNDLEWLDDHPEALRNIAPQVVALIADVEKWSHVKWGSDEDAGMSVLLSLALLKGSIAAERGRADE